MSQHEDAVLKEELARTDPEFRRLVAEHQDSERRLQEIYRKSLLTEEDEILEKRIKLHKLALKDRIEALLRAHREARVAVSG
jgi:uncharacterized protein YdcH (DUF465 family)